MSRNLGWHRLSRVDYAHILAHIGRHGLKDLMSSARRVPDLPSNGTSSAIVEKHGFSIDLGFFPPSDVGEASGSDAAIEKFIRYALAKAECAGNSRRFAGQGWFRTTSRH
jgi:hypothetical protein